ncbi:MAG: hypothetical protein H6660_01370 [Ardenticatenaceae bacterium]|nr:hypothetical protein [Ardenticatenaceae bacterium]
MKQCDYLEIGTNGDGINVFCTDQETLNAFWEEVKERIPHRIVRSHNMYRSGDEKEVGPEVHFGNDLLDEAIFATFTQLEGKDHALAMLLFKKACKEGWTPMNLDTAEGEKRGILFSSKVTFARYQLRREQLV